MKNFSLLRKCMLAFLLTLLVCGRHADAQLIPGMDAVVTMFSDTPTGRPVAMVKRVGDPLGAGAPFSSINQWKPPTVAPPITAWNFKNMGQVFGTTIDATGNVFFAATAMYYVPTLTGYPNAQRMVDVVVPQAPVNFSSFHVTPGGDVGLIYKADAANLNNLSCIVTAKATIAGTGVGTTKLFNNGFGIGNIAYSKMYDKIYASNLEDGKIYCINPSTGNIDYAFDPMAADAGTIDIAPIGERIFAVGVNDEFDGTTRLYYSVLTSSLGTSFQSVIRSVQLTANGDFLGASDALEINVPSSTSKNYVSDIAFSVRGELLVAEKGAAHDARVYQYYGRHNAWSLPQDMPVANVSTMHNSGGGVDYGFMKANGKTVCDSLIWTMENAMNGTKWYGMQSIPHDGYAPFTGTGFGDQAYIVDLDEDSMQVRNPKGKFGDIVFFDSSCAGSGPTDICGLVSFSVVKDTGGCCYNIYASNKYHGGYFTALSIETGHLNIDNVTAGSTWGGITYRAEKNVVFGDTTHTWYMPKDSANSSGFLLARICVSGTGNDVVTAKWTGTNPQFSVVCEKKINIEGCGVPVDTNCVGIINQKAICEDGVVKMQFQVKNNSAFTMRSVTLFPINPDVKPTRTFMPIADLLPGGISPVYTVTLVVKNNAKTGCFFFSACDLNVFPGTSGQYPKFCCMDSIQYCVDIPTCDSCDAIDISATKSDSSGNCCYKLTLSNNLLSTAISCIRFKGLNGTQFAILSGWNIQAPVSSSEITICAPGSVIAPGSYIDFANFCLTGTSEAPHQVSVEFLTKDGKVICSKMLEFSDCELVKPTCASIVEDSMYCDGKKNMYSFHIKNNSTFALRQIDLRLSDTSFTLDKYLIIPDSAIAPGATAGPYVITIDSSTEGNKTFCMYLTGHNNIYIPDSLAATECCTDSLGVICLPFISCDSADCCTTCCEFANLVVPSGITPNNDGFNDLLVIENSVLCSDIKITVLNRWGNVVFKDEHYNNNWAGTNMKGETLPQGTYFIVIELANGSKKSTYIDIRY